MRTLLATFTVAALMAAPSLAQTASGSGVTAGVNVNADLGNPPQIGCRLNPRNRNCASGPRPEQRQPDQRRTGGRGGQPRR